MKVKIRKSNPEIIAVDYKTGKVSLFPAPLQLAIYALYLFLKFPEVDTIYTSFVYVEHNQEKIYKFQRKHINSMTKKIIEKIINIENEKDFPQKESKLCDFCDFRKAGLCLPETHDIFEKRMMKYN